MMRQMQSINHPGGFARMLLRVAALGACSLALSGCLSPRPVASVPNDYRLRHPITIKEGERTVEVFVGSNRGGLTPAQSADVLSFAQAWRRESTGGIIVDIPVGTRNARAAAETLGEIQSILTASGVPASGIYVRRYRPKDPSQFATIRLNYSKLLAEAGPCGLWPDDLGASMHSDTENRPYWNLGCASQRNLAAMVDNPADLVQPRGEQPAYTARRTTAIDKYRKGETTGSTDTSSDKAKISDVGK